MYYSVTFGGEKNTWDDWHLIPSTPPMISPPEPVTNLVDIPGRPAGPIDLTLFPFSRLQYKRITGTWTFVRDTTYKEMRVDMYEEIRRYLHGRVMSVSLEEDAAHYFRGRFVVSVPQNSAGPTSITIGYDLEPARYNMTDHSVDTSWVDVDGTGTTDPTVVRAKGLYF